MVSLKMIVRAEFFGFVVKRIPVKQKQALKQSSLSEGQRPDWQVCDGVFGPQRGFGPVSNSHAGLAIRCE
jgi:hypothetical protein